MSPACPVERINRPLIYGTTYRYRVGGSGIPRRRCRLADRAKSVYEKYGFVPLLGDPFRLGIVYSLDFDGKNPDVRRMERFPIAWKPPL
jgi:hypothetical protein